MCVGGFTFEFYLINKYILAMLYLKTNSSPFVHSVFVPHSGKEITCYCSYSRNFDQFIKLNGQLHALVAQLRWYNDKVYHKIM